LLQLSEGQQTSILKFIHERIPCNLRESKYYEYRSPMCRMCNNYIECQNHILCCKNCQNRQKLRKNYLMKLQNMMITMGTNSTVIRVLLAYINAWLNQTESPIMEDIAPEASDTLRKAVQEQTSIGWDQWFRGRISRTWGELYNSEIQKPNILTYKPSALKWGRSVISETFKFVLDSWNTRNKQEHDTHGDPITRQKEKLCAQILWEQSRLNCTNTNTMTYEEIIGLPRANIEMMLAQIKEKKNNTKNKK
jgi:hypothetical protein